LDVVTVRYGNVDGPRQTSHAEAGVIAIFCDRVLAGRRPTVYGDGRQTRDFIFVSDIAAANLAAATVRELPHHEYDIGTGTEISVLELAEAVAAAAGVDPCEFRPDYAPARPGELVRSCLDTTRARSELHLAPPTPLSDGLAHTLNTPRTS
jgi:UDP-glucose 4-epimerase